jgi:hypothetical protein
MFGTTNSGSSEPIDAPPGVVGMLGYFLKLSVSLCTMATGYTIVQPLSAPVRQVYGSEPGRVHWLHDDSCGSKNEPAYAGARCARGRVRGNDRGSN